MERCDTIVVGLGAMGSAAAFHLARRGRRVVGLEQFALAHDRGSSHSRSRITRQAYFENPAYVPLLRRATELWTHLQRDSGLRVMEGTGGLMLGPPDGGVVRGTLASARQHGLPHEVLEAAELRRRYPAFRVEDGTIGVLEHGPGQVFYGFPALGDDGVKVARHHTGEKCTPASIRREVGAEEISGIREFLEARLPAVNGQLLSAKTCMYTNTPDGHFLLDWHPHHPNVILASPCSGHGFKFASVIGEILADLSCDRRTRHPIEMFRLERFGRAG